MASSIPLQRDRVAMFSAVQDKLVADHAILSEKGDSGGKSSKGLQNLISTCYDVVAILEMFSDLHPAVAIVTKGFKIVIQLELNRSVTDKRIAALHLQMTTLVLLIPPLYPVIEEDDEFKDNLGNILDRIKDTIDEFGNFCDVYYKHGNFVRWIRSTQYRDDLLETAEKFLNHRGDLQQLLNSKTSASIVIIKRNFTPVFDKLDNITRILESMNAQERRVAALVKEHGGEERVLQDNAALEEIAKVMKEKLTLSIRSALQADLKQVLEQNASLYHLKVEATGQRMEDAVARGTNTILTRLDAGPHEAIEDPDIQAVWKEMNWRNTCKVRHFVEAVQHHFARQFSAYHAQTGSPHPDQWTLEFIGRLIFYPPIGDSIDQDGSGFISIQEVNLFFTRKPEGWKTPEWMAYWGAGWYRNNLEYHADCDKHLSSMEGNRKVVHSGNWADLREYLGKHVIGDVRLILGSVYLDNDDYSGRDFDFSNGRFDSLVLEMKKQDMESIKRLLEQVAYRIDDPNAVAALCGTSKLEHNYLCLLSLILERHAQVVEIGKDYFLSWQEFATMRDTIDTVTSAFDMRLETLLESWRQQRIDTRLQLQGFASGLFEDWWKVFYDETDEDDSETEEEYDGGDEEDESDDDDDEPNNDDGEPNNDDGEPNNDDGEPNTGGSDVEDDRPALIQKNKLDPKSILAFPLPDQNTEHDEAESQASEESEDETPGIPISKHRMRELENQRRMDAMEKKLDTIEALLRQMLSELGQGQTPASTST